MVPHSREKIFDVEVRLIPRVGISYDKQTMSEPDGIMRTFQFGWLTFFIWKKR